MREIALKEAIKQCETPTYILDLDTLDKRLQMIEDKLGAYAHICYAMKANPFLIKFLEKRVKYFEVCSPGELRICEEMGIAMDKVVVSGVYKEKNEIEHVVHMYNGCASLTVESKRQLQLLDECARESKKIISVLLRITSGNQFGLDEEDIYEIIRVRDQYEYLDIRGLQYYSGTQKKKQCNIQSEMEYLDDIIEKLKRMSGFEVQELEYGPGLYVPYFVKEEVPEEAKMLETFAGVLGNMRYKGHITLEIGRYLAATCGNYVTKIVDKKVNQGQNYCIVDGGIHHLNYYGQTLGMKIPSVKHIKTCESGEKTSWTICGSLCTVGDVIVKRLPLDNVAIGDKLVFENVGAYSITEGIYLFLSRNMPKVYTYSATGGMRLVRGDLPTYRMNTAEYL